ncbi:sigma-70 family RNA polymerase sigma factor [Acinetobacter larvae]|uniref:RNA polymerase subunit sigma n=1 Tax=Acinetobacter larvae TaxID=1789224 RepID=A0A1B2LYA5_9GAMM|nr:sigma-70 family RNA polymerase sigma factor [Acinetobacter larvae]AOA57921.1 hypothetical protein BFG52_05855 [Acinetobacter larvae]
MVIPADLTALVGDLYQQHHFWLYQWLRNKLSSTDRAEDVLQDTFVRILKSKELFKLKEPRAFLCTTAKHIIVDQARREKIEQNYLHYASQWADEQFYPSPEQLLSVIELLDQLALTLSRLEERPRKILLWHYLDGISQIEIAAQLQLSVKTVQRDLTKALVYCYQIRQAG